ncbi:MAG: hypothetical protein IPF99_10100 [Deltaproteobacteria bacterium]|jgi:hypothetical protein|nr:hypothetical protein [Deltaproteobacteria bacterium]MBK7064754.1 hypothetical protein [Deltaproteobacteria bacterium]MBP6833524.1 hypothetical protein [Deltaproteobacteria bacterium]
MRSRRPIASPRSSALPTLVALLAAGVSFEGCLTEAHAQTPPRVDAGTGARPIHPPPPPTPPGGIAPVHPHPTPPPPPPPPRPEPPISVEGGIGKVSALK